jgi:cytochrome c
LKKRKTVLITEIKMTMRKGIALGAVLFPLFLATSVVAETIKLEVKDEAGKQLTGDTAKGEVVFKKCGACHSIKAGENRVGPSMHAVIGRTAGTIPGYAYSAANKNSGIVWTEQKLFTYLEKPTATIPGTKMVFPGLPKAEDRLDVIAYLQTAGK